MEEEKEEILADTPQTFSNMTWVALGSESSQRLSEIWTSTISMPFTTTTTIRYSLDETKAKAL